MCEDQDNGTELVEVSFCCPDPNCQNEWLAEGTEDADGIVELPEGTDRCPTCREKGVRV